MPELPRIDEHSVEIDAPPERVWAALGQMLGGSSRGSAARAIGRALRVVPLDPAGDPLAAGSTLRGFRVARAQPGAELALEGSHRFSRYALVFRIDPLGPSRARLRAETLAEFPGPAGRVYRALVIGTRGHVLAVRRMLEATRRRAG